METMNEMRVDFRAVPENETFARMVVSAFLLPVNPTLEQLGDVKTAVSEAVTNAIVHGYAGDSRAFVRLKAWLCADQTLWVEIVDNGRGIEDIARARTPFFTTLEGAERSGMGFTVMESFMDALDVISLPGQGTTVRMCKRLTDGDARAAAAGDA